MQTNFGLQHESGRGYYWTNKANIVNPKSAGSRLPAAERKPREDARRCSPFVRCEDARTNLSRDTLETGGRQRPAQSRTEHVHLVNTQVSKH